MGLALGPQLPPLDVKIVLVVCFVTGSIHSIMRFR